MNNGLCLNLFIKYNIDDANKFITNLEILNRYVMILAVDGASCRTKLKKLDIKICNQIENHKYSECSLYDDEMESCYEMDRLCDDEHVPLIMKAKKKKDYYASLDTDLFSSIMLYSIMQTIHKIIEKNCEYIVLNKTITTITLCTADEILYKISVPDIISSVGSNIYPWLEPVERHDIGLIGTVNDLVKMLQIATDNKNTPKKLILSGYGQINNNNTSKKIKKKECS